MPRLNPNRLGRACLLVTALSLSLLLALVAGAAAKGFQAKLRVVGSGGRTLAEKTVTTGATSVKTSPKATCFGAGTGGSGKAVALKANTAMGLLARGARTTGALKPLSISDSFDFGLALCGIGGSVAKGSSSWYLKINHKAQAVSGDAAVIRPGDEVLWALAKTTAPSYKYPEELVVTAPHSVKKGQSFAARVFSYDEKGKRKPVAGARLTGASGPTDAQGKTMVTLNGPRRLAATKSGLIPSAKVAVCIGRKCPAGS